MWWPHPIAELSREGIRILTPLADGSPGAELVLQPDGDVINHVTEAFLLDSDAQRRHAAALRGKLARLRWLGALTRTLTSAVVTATSASLAVLHDGLATKLPLASFLLVLLLRVFRKHRRRPDKPLQNSGDRIGPAGVRVSRLRQRSLLEP